MEIKLMIEIEADGISLTDAKNAIQQSFLVWGYTGKRGGTDNPLKVGDNNQIRNENGISIGHWAVRASL